MFSGNAPYPGCAQTILGKVRSIGVSNCSEVKLEEILQTAEIVPAVNQAYTAFTHQFMNAY